LPARVAIVPFGLLLLVAALAALAAARVRIGVREGFVAVVALGAWAVVTWQTPRFVHEGTGRELALVLLVAAACAAVAAAATVSPARRPAPVPADSPPLRR